MTGLGFADRGTRRQPATQPPAGAPDGQEPPAPPPSGGGTSVRWIYQWEDSLNALGAPVVEPPLPSRIVAELERAGIGGTASTLFFVRGELGIGKSTLAELLLVALRESAASSEHKDVRNALETAVVLEALDLESPTEFATRVKESVVAGRRVIALARPGTLDVAAQWIGRAPDATVTMRPFEPTGPLFRDCLDAVAQASGLSGSHYDSLLKLASRLPSFMQTPFYFHELASSVASDPDPFNSSTGSPLQLIQRSIERKTAAFGDLVDCAVGTKFPDEVTEVPGILDGSGFRHDGYRNVIMAAAVIDGTIRFDSLTSAPNSLPAVRLLLDHVEHSWRGRSLDLGDALLSQLQEFVDSDPGSSTASHPIFLQAHVARAFRHIRNEAAAEVVRQRCLDAIAARGSSGNAFDANTWWDVSDALSILGDPRLRQARRAKFAQGSGFFTFVSLDATVGSEEIPIRRDDAKPVLPYAPTTLIVGPLWVSNFLVTNELFAEFWADPSRDEHFHGTGAQWNRADPDLLAEVEAEFDIAANRCFWKEMQEQHKVAVSGYGESAMSILEVARHRALRTDRVRLWDPTQADDRFSADGNPVVGINWWEAVAFCRWWTRSKLPEAGFPTGSRAELLTDWEWEAIRRHYYQESPEEGPSYPKPSYEAHLRNPSSQRAGGVRTNVMRPLHVGLAPVPAGEGPFDMVGNVWEWTRSRVFGRIVREDSESGPFGGTAWTDVDPDAERTPTAAGRDVQDRENDLSYRAVRGGSFFSMDEQAAWHPAYRLCDPPFSSYMDLGFRFAVYPPDPYPEDQ